MDDDFALTNPESAVGWPNLKKAPSKKWKGLAINQVPTDTLPDDWTGTCPTPDRVSAERRKGPNAEE
jgi:hypothetical protein